MSASNQGEPAVLLVIVAVLLFGILWLIWASTGDFWLDNFFRWLRYSELWVINLFTPNKYGACLDWLLTAKVQGEKPPSQIFALTDACFGVAYLKQVPGSDLSSYYALTMLPIKALGAEAEMYYRWLLLPPLVGIVLYGTVFSPQNKFLTRHTLESLIAVQAKMWPVISPIVKFNPAKTGRILGSIVPDKLPMFAEALSPEEWLSWNRIPVRNKVPDKDSVRRAFIQQLGPRWTGSVSSLPIHMRGLLAAFALKGVQKREESDAFLGRLAQQWSPQKGFAPSEDVRKEIDKILNDPKLGGLLGPILAKHAWRTTAILGVLQWARNGGGVLAPAQFLWLRAEDRALWYPLNNLGRRAYHSEGAGAIAHYMAETIAKKPLPIPRVDTAIVTVNTYLNDPDKRPVPIPPREEPKRG